MSLGDGDSGSRNAERPAPVPGQAERSHGLAAAIRSVAVFEGAKGMLVLLAGFGLLSLLHRDLQELVERLILHLHLNPAAHYPHIFIDAAARMTDLRIVLLAAGAAAYATLRFVESWGLWHERRWAEWLAAISGGIYLPFEAYELFHKPGWLSAGTFTLNVAIVAIMLVNVARERARTRPDG